jgi:HAD superfamily hydrolase (TIGR01549 family)
VPLAIFDLDNTLIDRAASFRRWAARFGAAHGLEPADVAWLVDADGDGFVPRSQLLSGIRERFSVDLPLKAYQAEIVELVELDPAVASALDELRASGWKVAIATNGETSQQSAKIRRTGLEAHVDAVAISEEVGERKPGQRIFRAAAERCGVRLLDGGWMIGDAPDADIAGGRNAGLRTVWMRRGREWESAFPLPDGMAEDIRAAVQALRASPQS